MMLRSLGARTLLVTMDILPGHGFMNSEWVFDLTLLSRPLMRLIYILVSFMIKLAYFLVISTMVYFLEGPLVMI